MSLLSSFTASTSTTIRVSSTPRTRTLEVTIYRCTDISTDKNAGVQVIEKKREYFVQVIAGDETQQTRNCRASKGALEWNEQFTFHDVETSSMTLSLYYHRTLRKPKLARQLTILLPETSGDDTPLPISRTTTFANGPQIEFGITVKDSRIHDITGSEETKRSLMDSPIPHSEVKFPEPQSAPFVEKDHDDKMNEEDKAVEKAKRALETQTTLEVGSIWRRLLEGVQSFREIATGISEVHPFAKAACAIFYAIPTALIEQMERDEELRTLFDAFTNFCDIINDSNDTGLCKHDKIRDVLRRTSLQMTEVAYFIRDYCKSGNFVKRALKNTVSGVDDTIGEYRTKLEELKDEFCIRLVLETGNIVGQTKAIATRTETIVSRTEIKVVRVLRTVEEIAQSIDLNDMIYAPGAGLDTDKICLDGTRTEILDEILDWASMDGSRAMLLSGGAGTGKSSIAHTIAARFKELGRLGSMFCFSETEKSSRKPTSLFPHIARDLADLDESIRAELWKAAQNKADRTTSSITSQFEKLVLAPVHAIHQNLHGPIVIVIDALDESGSVEERRGLLSVLATKLKDLPPNFRILITSRPDLDIQIALHSCPDLRIKKMHAISQQSTAEDIGVYVRRQLADDFDVSDDMCRNLALQARGLFQWAKVACDFVRNREPGETALDRYEEITRPIASRSEDLDEDTGDTLLDYLYRAVLSKVLHSRRKTAMENFKFVMGRIFASLEPMSCNCLNRLIAASNVAPKNCKTENVVTYLGSVLSGVDDRDTPIRPLHTSFRDFLTDPKRSGEFFVDADSPGIHVDITSASLTIMKQELRFNICQLPTSYLANKDVPGIEGLIAKHISPHLSYACRFWSAHLCSLSDISADDWRKLGNQMLELIDNQALYWLEVLSLLEASDSGLQQLRRVHSWMKAKVTNKEAALLVEDLVRFWSYFAKCIARSAPHIYVSALPFAPKSSMIANRHKTLYSSSLSIAIGQLERYPSCLNVLHGHTSAVCSVAFSPDGTRIVSGSDDRTIRVWNAENGEMIVGPLEGHSDFVISVAWSPDGAYIVSGSQDMTIRVWNAENGEMVLGPLKGHVDSISSVVFSPDGSRIVSGSRDKTIRLWNAQNGSMVLEPLRGHTNWVTAVAFSTDGTRIVSSSRDRTICLWSTEKGEMILGPLKGHTNLIYSVAFSPDGARIISSSRDKTIRVWDSHTGEVILGPLKGHADPVYSAAFSPDGTHIISGSLDRTIRVWNAESGENVGMFEGHTDFVFSVAFSPDGTRIISSARDRTIRIWDAQNSELLLGTLDGHTDVVYSVVFSPDGTRIISGSFDKTIRVWDARNGKLILGPLRGHTDWIMSVALSPDGTRIISGSRDKTIRLWDAKTGELLCPAIEGHTNFVYSVAFSPDGSRIVSGSKDRTVRIWNLESGEMVFAPLCGHTDSVDSVAFLPDGTRVVSSSQDMTIRLWNAETGEMVLGPLHGHTGPIYSVIPSPDGSRIFSCSQDGTIRVWNAETGEIVLQPLRGHTDWVVSAVLSPDGAYIVSCSKDGTIRFWNSTDGSMASEPLYGHNGCVISVALSPDGHRLVSCSEDKTIRVQYLRGFVGLKNLDSLHLISDRSNSLRLSTFQARWRVDDGWWLSENGEHLFYVPPVHRQGLWGPGTEVIISRQQTKLDLSRFKHGSQWTESLIMNPGAIS